MPEPREPSSQVSSSSAVARFDAEIVDVARGLCGTLRKIEAMKLGDVEARKLEKTSGWSLGRSQWPNIIQRIENISDPATQ